MKQNRVREKLLEKDGIALGPTVQMGSPETAELAAHAGFDFVLIDGEHGSFGFETAVNMFRAVDSGGATPIIRLADDSPSRIARALDAGAMGILIPNVSSREQTERIVAAAKYGPQGKRGACPLTRATNHGLCEWREFQQWSNDNTMVWLLIEDRDGAENFGEIATVPGIDAIGVGRFDLAQSLGLNGDITHPEVTSAADRVIDKACKQGIPLISFLFEWQPTDVARLIPLCMDQGSRIVVLGPDRQILSDAYKGTLDAVRPLTARRVKG